MALRKPTCGVIRKEIDSLNSAEWHRTVSREVDIWELRVIRSLEYRDQRSSAFHSCNTYQQIVCVDLELTFSRQMTYMSYRTANLQTLHFVYLFNKYT